MTHNFCKNYLTLYENNKNNKEFEALLRPLFEECKNQSNILTPKEIQVEYNYLRTKTDLLYTWEQTDKTHLQEKLEDFKIAKTEYEEIFDSKK